jgi:hypothetical protein
MNLKKRNFVRGGGYGGHRNGSVTMRKFGEGMDLMPVNAHSKEEI